jgi:hypothetical protein
VSQLPLLSSGSEAVISACGRYRYSLRRKWRDAPNVAFLMFNPSTADAVDDDHTIRKCIGFADRWGYGGIVVVNLFAVRSSAPRAVVTADDPIGPGNNTAIMEALRGCLDLVCAWGCSSHMRGRLAQRPVELLNAVRHAHPEIPIMCLGYSKDGSPRHPLMLPYTTEREFFFFSGGHVS